MVSNVSAMDEYVCGCDYEEGKGESGVGDVRKKRTEMLRARAGAMGPGP